MNINALHSSWYAGTPGECLIRLDELPEYIFVASHFRGWSQYSLSSSTICLRKHKVDQSITMNTYPQIYNYARQPLGETSTEIKIHITILIRLKSNSISKPAMGMNYWRGRRGVWALPVIKSSHVLSTLGRMGLPGNEVTSDTFSPAYRYNDNHYTDNELYDEYENNNERKWYYW